MRKFIFGALVALCLTVPGTVSATPIVSVEMMASPEIAPHLVESILRAASEQSAWTFEELYLMYNDGTLTIDKVGSSYVVTILGAEGGGITLLEDLL